MSYLSLYRKFRPVDFDEVKGQDHVVQTLKNQIKTGRIGHAYLFCGTRGTGKTSVAKVFARAVNCTNPVDGNPCGQCESCKSALDGSNIDIIEMDAASNRKVDDVRQINDEVRYAPTNNKYKVYIIDEVHMFTSEAYNALLKTLEEPPEYVIFILATTEANTIPITILSRCQRYDFRHISLDVISDRLFELMQIEGIDIEDKAVRYISKVADGSMRDALSLLDRCIGFYVGEKITYDMVIDVLGTVDTEVFEKLLEAIVTDDVNRCLKIIEEMIVEGRELTRFTTDFIWYIRNLLLIKVSGDVSEILDVSSERLEVMKEDAKLFDENVLMRFIRVLSETASTMKFADNKRVLLEVAIIKLIKPMMEGDLSSVTNRVANLERKIESGQFVTAPAGDAAVKTAPAEDENEGEVVGTLETPVPEDIQYIIDNWDSITKDVSGLYRVLCASGRKFVDKNGNLALAYEEDSYAYDMLVKPGVIDNLQGVLSAATKKDIKMLVVKENDIRKNSQDYRNVNPFNIEVEEED